MTEFCLPKTPQDCESCAYPTQATVVIAGMALCDRCAGEKLVAEREVLGAMLARLLRRP